LAAEGFKAAVAHRTFFIIHMGVPPYLDKHRLPQAFWQPLSKLAYAFRAVLVRYFNSLDKKYTII